MPACEFSERQYEFCANYQLQVVWGAYLVGGMPAIPSQADEALAGYDAAYQFSGGRAVFLQYKVAHFAPRAHGTGAATFRLWGRPYFRAPLHQDRHQQHTQHNTLIDLASPSAAALYVAPCFATHAELRNLFGAGRGPRVIQQSLLAGVSEMPRINDSNVHSITYPRDGSAFRLHSEPSDPYRTYSSFESVLGSLDEAAWGSAYFSKLRDRLRGILGEHDIRPPELPEGTEYNGPLVEVAAILTQTLGAVMALFPSRTSAR